MVNVPYPHPKSTTSPQPCSNRSFRMVDSGSKNPDHIPSSGIPLSRVFTRSSFRRHKILGPLGTLSDVRLDLPLSDQRLQQVAHWNVSEFVELPNQIPRRIFLALVTFHPPANAISDLIEVPPSSLLDLLRLGPNRLAVID